ncbi:MAG: sigma-70 family RNA polymerase sigma factor [Puniceicoccales bacterium]|nr:sigma-70 family RNA polymerase sigma factor [Puniceicoccales bacterium]
MAKVESGVESGIPSAEEERELLARIKTGDMGARERVILSNVGLIRKWARHYRYFGVPLEDLIQEGHRGLIHAVDCFVSTGEARLSTYATWWIRHYIRQAIARQTHPFHLPVPILESIRRLKLTSTMLQERFNREPSNSEIAAEMGCSVTHVQTLKSVIGTVIPLHQSNESDPNGDFGGTLADSLSDPQQPTPLEHLLNATLPDDVESWLKTLSKRESEILRMRFGLGGGGAHTFEEIGNHFDLNRERVRQIAQTALEKLRKML